MNSIVDPVSIRRKVYMTYFQDGMWDIVLGLFFFGWGFAVLFDFGWLPGATFISSFYIALSLKHKITYPRIGFSRLTENRKRASISIILGVVVLLGIIILLPVFNPAVKQVLQNYFEFLFGTMLAVAVGLIGYWWRITRWYWYAGMVFILATVNQWLGLSFHLSFIIPGIVILSCGVFFFVLFLRKYPKVAEEDLSDNR